MRISCALCLTALFVATSAVAEPTTPFDEASWTSGLKQVLADHASLDNRPITDVQRAGTCRTRFVTSDADTVVDWSKVKDVADHGIGDGEAFEIVENGPHPTISVPGEDRGSLAAEAFTAIRQCFQTNAGS